MDLDLELTPERRRQYVRLRSTTDGQPLALLPPLAGAAEPAAEPESDATCCPPRERGWGLVSFSVRTCPHGEARASMASLDRTTRRLLPIDLGPYHLLSPSQVEMIRLVEWLAGQERYPCEPLRW